MPLLQLSFASGEDSLSVRRFVIHEASSAASATLRAKTPGVSNVVENDTMPSIAMLSRPGL